MELDYKYFDENFDGDLEGIVEKKEFELYQFKLEHHHWNSGDIDVGYPITTSVELRKKYNYETDKEEWEKVVSHTYYSFENCHEQTTDSYSEIITNGEVLVNEIKKYDLRELKNNYFTDESPEKYTYWTITYNYYFNISGTYDQEIEPLVKMREVLDLKNIIELEVNKIEQRKRELEN